MTRDPLITQALLGAARMTALPAPPAAELAELWPRLDPRNPADSLLRALALSRALHLAGAKPVALDEDAAPPCPEETRPLLAAAMMGVGRRLLEGDFAELLHEWLDAAAAAGTVVPPRMLPVLLPLATRHHAHRPAVRRICGERGLWLARHHPEFSWLLENASADDSAWDDGQPAERLAWLRHTRLTDPDRARSAVAAQWAGEDPLMRQRIVRLIAENPTADDVPFLEADALRDRRQEVREPALGALMQIPGSPLRQRAMVRAGALVRIERKLLRRRLIVEPPAAFDPAWAADGIKEKPPQGTGEKAWWLRQLVALVPVAAWPEMLETPAVELFALPVDGDWAEPLWLGWMDAARRLPGLAALRDFIPWLAALDPWPKSAAPHGQLIVQLLEPLPPEETYIILESIHGRCPPDLMLDLLSRCPTAAPVGAAPKCLATLRAALRQVPCPITRPTARLLARCLPPAEIDSELRALASLPDLTGAAEEFAATLELRRQIHPSATP